MKSNKELRMLSTNLNYENVDQENYNNNSLMSVDELVSVVDQANFLPTQQQTVPVSYIYPQQQQFLINYHQQPTHQLQSYAFMSTTDFSHPPPNTSNTQYRPNVGPVIVAPTNLQNFVPTAATYLTTDNYGMQCATDTNNGPIAYMAENQTYVPYPYASTAAAPLAYGHYQSVQPPVVYAPTASPAPQMVYGKTKPRNQASASQTAYSLSDTGSSLIKASAASDTASSCSGGGGGRNSVTENYQNFQSQRASNTNGNMQMRRYSDPRPSTSKQEENQQQQNDTTNEMVVDSTSNVSKSSTIKSTEVDSIDSADSGLTADHSSPEHRTSTPTAANHTSYHYQQVPPPLRPHTLPFHNSAIRYEAPIAENQPNASTNNTNSQQINTGQSVGGMGGTSGMDGSRSSSPPPPPGSGDGGSNAGGTNSATGLALGFPPVGPHAVYVHVNLGETLSVRVGNEIQHIPGPATVRMVSSHNAGPPVPLPLHVPPGHVVQQIVDENGTLRHLILSPQTPQPPTATAGGTFPCVNLPNGPLASSVQYVPVNGSAPGPAVRAPMPPVNGVGPVPVAVLGPNECPQAPPYHPLHPPPVVHQPTAAPMVAVAPMPAHHTAMAAVRHPVLLHTNPPHICQLHINGGNGDDGHLYAAGDRAYSAKMMARNGGKTNHNQSVASAGGQRAYHTEYQDQETSSPLHDTTMDDNTSAATSGGNEDEEISKIAEMLSRIPPPQVCDIGPRDALVQWQPFDCSEASASGGPFPQIDASEFTYEILLFERRPEGKPTSNYRCQADQLQQQWLTNLKPSTEYFVRLRALLEERGLHGEPSSAVAFKTKPSHPDKMQPPRVQQRAKTWILLRWQPACDNGAKITGYHLEVDESGAAGGDANFKEVFCGQVKQFKLQKLQPSTLYRIRLAASNQHGKSEYSDILLVQTTGAPPVPPEPPMLVQATAHSMALQWKRRDGDDEFQLLMEDPQTGYGYLPVATTRDVSYVVQSLMRYKEYRFQLTASNEDGRSMPSETVTYRTLPARPQAPARPHAKGRVASNNVKIAWEQPKDTGGGEITSYILDMCNESAGSSNWATIFEGPEQEYHVNGLEPGVLYRFRLACYSAGGRSGFSDELHVTTSPVPPGPCRPVQLNGKPKATSLHLKWSPPEVRGGADISEYELIIEEPDVTQPTSTSSITNRAVYQGPRTDFLVSAGLLPGRTYAFRVRAYNRAGAGSWSDRFECQTASAPPDCPQRLRLVSQASTSLTLAWDAPSSTNGAPITEYRLHQACKTASHAEVLLTVSESRQSNSTECGAGARPASTPSSPSKSVKSATAASSSSSSTAGPIRQHSTVSNASSTSASGGQDVVIDSDYGSMNQVYAGSALSYEVKTLKAATDYVFKLQAVNSAGCSRLSEPLFCRTSAGVPDAPSNVRTEVLSLSEIFVQWDAPADNGSPVTGYYLDITPPPVNASGSDNTSPVTIPASLTQYTVESLLPDTTYRFRVQAFNEVGTGLFSSSAKAVTFSPPPLPPNLELAMASHNSLKLKWNEPSSSSSNDNAITYTVEMENKSGAFSPVAAELAARSCKVPRLNESTVYRFRIRAFSATGGAGPWSEVFAFRTSKTPPAAVKSAPKITDVTETSCQIDWQPVKLTGSGSVALSAGEKLHYSLQIQGPSSTNSDDYRTVYKGPSTSYHMNGLMQGSSYRVRVCTIRVSPSDADDVKETETFSAPSPTCSFSTVAAIVHKKGSESTSQDVGETEKASERVSLLELVRHPRQLSDSQWAVLILVVFSLAALLVAFMVQGFITSTATAPTTASTNTDSSSTYSNRGR